MNGAHLHLLVNHLPVLGALFGLGLGIYGLARKQEAVVHAALGVFILVGLAAFASDWTGGQAEHVLEEAVPAVSDDAIHEHAEFAEKAAISAYVLGVLAPLTLGLSWGRPLRRPFVWGTLAASLVVCGMMVYTANLGGEIRHTEIEASPPSAEAAPNASRE